MRSCQGFHYIFEGVERTGLVQWVGGPPDASFGFYLREAFQSQTNVFLLYSEINLKDF